MKSSTLFIPLFFFSLIASAQSIPSEKIIATTDLVKFMRSDVSKDLEGADNAVLASYFRSLFAKRFFYNYQTFDQRLPHYNAVFNNQEDHKKRALDHLGKFDDSTQWVLPFNYKNGAPVNAYALRHLARQHKMVDIAFYYFNGTRDPLLIDYFINQMNSLNTALEVGAYEKIEDGNGVYEAFRSGYRILNWLWIHNMFLNEPAYTDQDQLTTIATLLQHGQHLYQRNKTFRYGNHQTRGVSALAMLAILFQDFEGTDLWLKRAMHILGEHLDKEINVDGFQFERSVHYHMSDINNYFYVYQLAKLNDIDVDPAWENKLKGLFTTLVKIAYPDRSAPVLQDDTEIPWAEKNDISGAMTLGYLLFEDPEFGYFATDKVDDRVYWFLSNAQIAMLENIEKKRPSYGSMEFEETGYYIMREGWNTDDKMMIISAGLDPDKPDHQHGDMLGIQAMANGNAILPNYQVRYSLPDFDLFKNSMVKNVALVDDQLQGRDWRSNKGGSGFGKFGVLPKPEVITWQTSDDMDLFVGSHDGFENIGVAYSRQVIYVKDQFWVVKDNFSSDQTHDYKQVWQGHYSTEEGPDLIRATSQDASGHDIFQMATLDVVNSSGKRGKQWSVVTKNEQKNFSFITLIYPYKGYDNRIDEKSDNPIINDWVVNDTGLKIVGENAASLSSEEGIYLFNVSQFKYDDIAFESKQSIDVFISKSEDQIFIRSIDESDQSIKFSLDKKIINKTLKPGELFNLK